MNDIDAFVRIVADEIEMSPEIVNRRLALLRFSSREIELLRQQREWAWDLAADIVVRVFSEFAEHKELYKLFATEIPSEKNVAEVRDYIMDSFFGTPDVDYALRRSAAGIVQQRAGVTQVFYIGVLSRILDELVAAVRARPSMRPGDREETITALRKIHLLDLGFVLEAYSHADRRHLENMAKHDRLTGLPNHSLLIDKLNQTLEEESGHDICLIFIGLNQFKSINETLGHPVGDDILKEVARRLTSAIPSCCLVSRLGGDIFVLVADGYGSLQDAGDFSQLILNTLQSPVELEGFSVDISATLGVATAVGSEVDAVSLMRDAEIAMYHAKAQQLPTTHFETDMKRYSVTQLSLAADLRKAIENQELVLFYQPKIELTNGSVIGVEALIRWIHPMKGFMNPGQFIPFAERTVLIHPLTDWVLETAVGQCARWQQRGIDLVTSVNLAAPSLQNQQLPGHLSRLLVAHGVDPSRIMLEITESGLMSDPQRALSTIKELRKLGVRLSIDDFGTGYSSLAYLKTLPVNEVKVDQVFVFGMRKDRRDDQIVRATIRLGQSLGLEVAAEGVEDQETLDKLRLYGCDTVQGFLFSKPLPAEELELWLEKHGRDPKHRMISVHFFPLAPDGKTAEDRFPFVVWKDEYATGIDKIDIQHRNLFVIVNNIFAAAHSNGSDMQAVKRLFEELTEYTQTHFDMEENLMVRSNHPGVDNHLEIHRRFMRKLEKLGPKMDDPSQFDEALAYIKTWMTEHFLGTNMSFEAHRKTGTVPG